MSVLDVYMHGHEVGQLRRLPGAQLSFRYHEDWVARDGSPLSVSLPLRYQAFDDAEARPFFAGLLPEGEFLRSVAHAFQVSADNAFALLDAIGGECAGAVSLTPSGSGHPAPSPPLWLGREELARLVSRLPRNPLHLASGGEGLRLSLAGAQNKLPVIFGGGKIGISRGDRPSTHIIKLPPPGFEGLAENEAFCLALARAVGLNAIDGFVRYLDGTFEDETSGPALLQVERYDRYDLDGVTHRLHQEDFCQALGRLPAEKYESEGGPGVAACAALIHRTSAAPAVETLAFADALLFNMVIGNRDAHAKNFSILIEGERAPRLAPLYDLICTTAYFDLDRKMAMKLGEERRADYFRGRHLDRLATELGLSALGLRRRARDLCDRIEAALPEVGGIDEPFAPEFRAGKIFARMERQIAEGLHQLRTACDERH